MRRWLPFVLLLTGCSAAPVATAPSSTTTETTTTTVATTSPRIDTPRKLAGADPCQMLTAADLGGTLFGSPQPHPAVPRSCLMQVGPGTEKDMMVLVAFGDAYARPDKAVEMLIGDGHSAATSCAATPQGVECTTLVAINATESLKVVVRLPDGNADQVASIVQEHAKDAFARVPVTS
ncbi:hypothetical protein C8D87_1021166 [Lentzea atacamensis]|uniref:DUF3558 domain-containing protein n=1 Tax=Lentzea atacamensis TaxID=531938 RepID=A0ABX9EHF9_9PSEU|nr:hypothetical protein [Lentzea atacamensis]RAS69088.1 hypothetical protein C8D87_1021166 [Lentzea atacamensis]